MPELPDVEGYKRVLSRNGLRKTIERVAVSDARILDKLSARKFSSRLQDAKLVAARRYGKHLMAKIGGDGWLTLHFGMTGALKFVRSGEKAPAHTRVHFDFADGGCLAYINKRMLGHVGLAENAADVIAEEKLGPDALDPKFDFNAFKTAVSGTKRDVKSVLMDQQVMAGIGNVYSDEILFQARINPTKPIDRLSRVKLKRLFDEMRKVLETAVARGAGSEQFVDRLPKGFLLPERKKAGHCPLCGSPLKVLEVGGRTAYCCPRHQGC